MWTSASIAVRAVCNDILGRYHTMETRIVQHTKHSTFILKTHCLLTESCNWNYTTRYSVNKDTSLNLFLS